MKGEFAQSVKYQKCSFDSLFVNYDSLHTNRFYSQPLDDKKIKNWQKIWYVVFSVDQRLNTCVGLSLDEYYFHVL